ncbi:putative nuclease HARBI1 [Blattella germanica]|nr:putative nuclease HARBI1 [Blattella germanica]
MILFQTIGDLIQYATRRNHAVEPLHQLLLALRFFASGCMLITVGDFWGIHKSTASRIILRIARVIATLAQDKIKLPGIENEISASKTHFFQIARYPRVIGAVDCTHIRLQSPDKLIFFFLI